MRMIGIGLLGFLLAGIALLLSTLNIVDQGQRFIRDIATGPHLVFEHRTPAMAQDSHSATVTRTNSDHPVILSGFPAYQSVAFAMPVDARPTSGYLQINATAQVLDGVEGVLRVSIHNTRRGELLLRPGEVGRSLQIPLSPTDLAGPRLVVSFSLQGSGIQRQCRADDSLAAVVEIETTSALYLTLSEPLSSPRDRVRAWGEVARVDWPHGLKRPEQLGRLVLASALDRAGIGTVFQSGSSEPGMNAQDLRAVLAALPERPVRVAPNGHLAQSGPSAGVRRFHRKVTWRERYELTGPTAQDMPAELALDMVLGQLIGDQAWAVSVTLNDRLVFQTTVQGSQSAFSALIDLPAEIHAAANLVEVVATTTRDRKGLCDEGPELVTELLPTSRLIAGDAGFSDPMAAVHAALLRRSGVTIGLSGSLSAVDAALARDLLDRAIPSGAPFSPSLSDAQVTVIAPGAMTLHAPDKGPAWLVTLDALRKEASLRALGPGEAAATPGLALLIVPQAGLSPEAEG